jgi:hypothetical protein
MSTDNIPNVHPVSPAGPKAYPSGAAPDPDSDFRRILERLEAIAARASGAKGQEDPGELLEALRKADDDFMSVMDLRAQIEAAYRKRDQ